LGHVHEKQKSDCACGGSGNDDSPSLARRGKPRLLLCTILSTPPSRLHEEFSRRYETPQAMFREFITTIKIGMAPLGRTAESGSDRSFVGVGIDT